MQSQTPLIGRFAMLSVESCAAALPTFARCAPFENMPRPKNMTPSRRDFLKGCGALIVSFNVASVAPLPARGQRKSHASAIDSNKLDSWLAIGADGTITAYTGKCDFGQGIFTAQTQLGRGRIMRGALSRKADPVRHRYLPGPGDDLRQPVDADQL